MGRRRGGKSELNPQEFLLSGFHKFKETAKAAIHKDKSSVVEVPEAGKDNKRKI